MFLFKKTKRLQRKMEEFLDVTSESGLVFKEGIEHFLQEEQQKLAGSIDKISALESRADKLRRDIESQLYTETLIPESRGDVLALLENIDDINNLAKDTLVEFFIQEPQVPAELHADMNRLADHVSHAIDEVVRATRAFLKTPMTVRDYLHKVYHYEKEADGVAQELKRKVFQANLDLSTKLHLHFFITHMDILADQSEDVADRLAIYTLKRSV